MAAARSIRGAETARNPESGQPGNGRQDGDGQRQLREETSETSLMARQSDRSIEQVYAAARDEMTLREIISCTSQASMQ